MSYPRRAYTKRVAKHRRRVFRPEKKLRVEIEKLEFRQSCGFRRGAGIVPRLHSVCIALLGDTDVGSLCGEVLAVRGEVVGVEQGEGGHLMLLADGLARIGLLDCVRALAGGGKAGRPGDNQEPHVVGGVRGYGVGSRLAS